MQLMIFKFISNNSVMVPADWYGAQLTKQLSPSKITHPVEGAPLYGGTYDLRTGYEGLVDLTVYNHSLFPAIALAMRGGESIDIKYGLLSIKASAEMDDVVTYLDALSKSAWFVAVVSSHSGDPCTIGAMMAILGADNFLGCVTASAVADPYTTMTMARRLIPPAARTRRGTAPAPAPSAVMPSTSPASVVAPTQPKPIVAKQVPLKAVTTTEDWSSVLTAINSITTTAKRIYP